MNPSNQNVQPPKAESLDSLETPKKGRKEMYLVLSRQEPQSKRLPPPPNVHSPGVKLKSSGSNLGKGKPNFQRRKPCPSFVGKPNWHYSTSTSWFWCTKVNLILGQFKKCVDAEATEGASKLTIADLARPSGVVPVGAVEAGVLVYSENPSEIYIILEKFEYYSSAQESEWKKVFPGFNSGPEAFCGVQALLNLYYQCYESLGLNLKTGYEPYIGDLVAVKVIRKLESSGEKLMEGDTTGKGNYVCQMRRGVVMEIQSKNVPAEYTVYLLDFGYKITVCDHFLLPLNKPFNLIPPLAMRCALFGLSPVGEHWTEFAIEHFNCLLQKYREASFCFNFCSVVEPPFFGTDLQSFTTKKSYLVNMEARQFNFKTASVEYALNFAEDIIKNLHAVPWNLVPARPKLMAGTKVGKPDRGLSNPSMTVDPPRPVISLRTGLLLTKFHPILHEPLPLPVLERDIKQLFRMRGHSFTGVSGIQNQLVIPLKDRNKQFSAPCSVIGSYNKCWDLMKLKEREKGQDENELSYERHCDTDQK
ncbi:unnamed protein product [Orchesella dallaii]|uniref:Tudor domain-containing protein n=1 Tax=Orchesella dallaii TaxID=48710 RepID=A0ABP1RXR5_9HEXA